MKYYWIGFILLLAACVKETKPPIRATKPILVVEGLLLTDTTPCKVSLSYSGAFNSYGYLESNTITDAQVFLKNDTHDSILLTNNGNGDYTDEARQMTAAVGHSYSLSIYLSNGERYASRPEKVLPVSKDFDIDSVGIAFPFNIELHGANVLIRTQDPPDETNYYRWLTTGYIPRKSLGIPCGSTTNCRMFCYQYFEDHYINILSDQKVNGSEIRFQRASTTPFYWHGKHYLTIKQLSLSRQAYQFWQSYKEQTERSGSILDPLPASIAGNIYNANDSSELALGYFEASDVISKKIVVVPVFMYNYVVETPALPFGNVPGPCDEVYPNAMERAPKGWQDAPEFWKTIYFF